MMTRMISQLLAALLLIALSLNLIYLFFAGDWADPTFEILELIALCLITGFGLFLLCLSITDIAKFRR